MPDQQGPFSVRPGMVRLSGPTRSSADGVTAGQQHPTTINITIFIIMIHGHGGEVGGEKMLWMLSFLTLSHPPLSRSLSLTSTSQKATRGTAAVTGTRHRHTQVPTPTPTPTLTPTHAHPRIHMHMPAAKL